jgi:hypothetical protein
MLSWRGAAVGGARGGGLLILLLLDEGRIAQRASTESAPDQEMMQFNQRRYRHARRAELHSGTDCRIEHPCRNDDNDAGRRLDVDDLAAGTPLRILAPKPSPIEGVPPVVNLNLLPDMGRMTP